MARWSNYRHSTCVYKPNIPTLYYCCAIKRKIWKKWNTLKLLFGYSFDLLYSSRHSRHHRFGNKFYKMNINRDPLCIKDYLPTKLESSRAKCASVIIIWKSLRILYSSRTTYQVWNLGKSFLSHQLHKVLETNMTFDLDLPEYQSGPSSFQRLSSYKVWSFWDKAFLGNPLRKCDI